MARIIGLELGSRTVRAVVLDAGMRGYEVLGGAIVPIEEAPPRLPAEGAQVQGPAGEAPEPEAGGEAGLGQVLAPDFGQGRGADDEGAGAEAPAIGEEPHLLGGPGDEAPAAGTAPANEEGGGDPAAQAEREGAEDADFDPLGHALATLGEKIGGFKADLVVVALPEGKAATPFITLPFTETKKIEATLAFEVESLLPFDLEEAHYDYQIIAQREGGSDLLVGVTREEEVRALIEKLQAAGIDPRIITLPGLANLTLLEAYLDSDPLGPEEVEGLLDLGEERTVLTVVRGGADAKHGPKPTYLRVLGGLARGTEGPALTGMIRELRQCLFAAQTRDRHPLRRLRLVGDLAGDEGLAQRLERDLGVPVEPEESLPGAGAGSLAPEQHGPLAQAFGLALRGQSRSSRLFNLRKGPLAFRGDLDYLKGKVSRLVGMAASIVLLIGLSVWTHASTLKKQEESLDDALCQMTQRAIGSCERDFNVALAKLQGGDTKASQIPTASAMEVFAAAIDHVPSSIELRVQEIDATLDRLRIRGEVDSFDAVDQVIAELRKANCVGDVRPGRIQKNREEKIEFTIDALYVCGQNAANAGAR